MATSGKVDVLTSPAGAAVIAHHPLVDGLFVYHKRDQGRGIGGFRAASTWIRSRSIDAALLPRRSLRSALLARFAGVPRRIGFSHGPARWLFTAAVPFEKNFHQVERNLSLLGPLGGDPENCGLPGHPLEVFSTDEQQAKVDGWLAARDLSGPGYFYAMAPGSVWATKRWPLERFAALAETLTRRRPVVVLGGASERALARDLTRQVSDRARALVHDATDAFPPAGSVHLLASAAALISNDSGALHLGQAAGIPLVALFGPTTPEQGLAPRGEGHELLGRADLDCRPCGRHGAHTCPQKHWRCMLTLEVNDVAAAVERATREAA